MEKTTISGIDLAMCVFLVRGAAANGSMVFRKNFSRTQLLAFLVRQPAFQHCRDGGLRHGTLVEA